MRIMHWENECCPSSVSSSIAIGFENCIRIAIVVQSYSSSIILLLFLPPELWGDCMGVYGLHFDSRVENHWNWVAIRAERTAPGCPRPTYNLVLYLWPYVPGLRCDYRIASGL